MYYKSWHVLKRYKLRILLFVLLFINTLFSNIILDKNIDKKSNFILEKFYDSSKKLTIENIETKSFEKIPSQFTFGHEKGNIWFRFVIKNHSLYEDFILNFSEAYYHEMTLYKKVNNSWEKEKNGLILPFKQREVLNHNPTFHLKIKPNQIQTFYIKGNSKLTTSGEFEIYKKEYFNSIHGHSNDILYMFYLGAIFTITLINLFIYFRLKERVYLYYSGYTFFYTLWAAAYGGLILYTPVYQFFYKFLMVTPMFIMFLILFSSEFLNVKKHLPKLYKPLNIFGYIFGVLAILIVFSFEPWFEIMNTLASVLFLVLFSVAIYILRKNNDINTKYYLFAMSVYMVSMSLMSAMANGWIENSDINRYSFLFGSFFEILFFTLVLTNRFYIFQSEKFKIQNELLELKDKNEIILEKKIEDRTKNLTESNNKLSALVEERELLLKELKLLTITDPMTTLYNRRYFAEISKSIVALSKRKKENLSIIMIDIDKFKNVNDTYGHQFGDDIIISLSRILIESQRKSDIICRYGGEEFIILLPYTALDATAVVAEKIRILVESSRMTLPSNERFKFTISLGVAQVDIEKETNINDALKRADDGLYQAKNSGRNNVVVNALK